MSPIFARSYSIRSSAAGGLQAWAARSIASSFLLSSQEPEFYYMATQPSSLGQSCPASVNIATLQNGTGRHPECHTQNKRNHLREDARELLILNSSTKEDAQTRTLKSWGA